MSLLVAYILPFQLFLLSYALLGPLHYLTEIRWLHGRRLFTEDNRDFVPFLAIAGLVFLSILTTELIITACIFAVVALSVRNLWLKVAALLAGTVIAIASTSLFPELTLAFFGILLPTVVHVFIFTALFMLYGALKSKSWRGLLSFWMLLGSALFIVVFRPSEALPLNSVYVFENFTYFASVSSYSSASLGSGFLTLQQVFFSETGLVIARFLAFAYTYHYLNWFSKTKIIGWQKGSKHITYAIVAIWIASIGLYAYDYRVGLEWLFVLSLGHVLLELPLNFKTMAGIRHELRIKKTAH